MYRFKRYLLAGAAALFTFSFSVPAVPAPPKDWSAVPTQTIKLFYPGQSTYQWLRSKEHKRADKKTKKGEACIECHEDEEEDIGNLIAAGERLEPANLSGKQGIIDLGVQVAYDTKNIYWRFQWKTKNNFPGRAHPQLRYDGKSWKTYGYPMLHEQVQTGKQPAIYEDRFSMMIDDGTVPMFKEQGCWLTCHDGQRDMPGKATTDQVKAHPLLGEVLKKKDVRKYLPASRTDENVTWDKTKSVDEIAKIKAAGGFVDLMQWRAHRSNIVGMGDDGYVLEYRLFDTGKKMFSSNEDKKAHQPKFMYDAKKTGTRSVTDDDLRDPSKPYALVRERNAVPFDPNAGWKPGDMVPRYVLTREGTQGSAADNNNTSGEWKNGTWTVLWTRLLDTGHPQDDKILKEGGVYSIGFAVHDDNITTRGHHVSWPFTLGIGTEADIVATKVN